MLVGHAQPHGALKGTESESDRHLEGLETLNSLSLTLFSQRPTLTMALHCHRDRGNTRGNRYGVSSKPVLAGRAAESAELGAMPRTPQAAGSAARSSAAAASRSRLPERQTLRPAGSVLGPVSNCMENELLGRTAASAELQPPIPFMQDEVGRGDGTVSQVRRGVRRRARLRVAVDVDEGCSLWLCI